VKDTPFGPQVESDFSIDGRQDLPRSALIVLSVFLTMSQSFANWVCGILWWMYEDKHCNLKKSTLS
jgi:hypothetical protein